MIDDLQPIWLNVARRLQSAAAKQDGAAIISVKIVVSGVNPVFWTEPEVVKLEPKARSETIIKTILD